MMSGLENPLHWLIVLAVVLIVLGPKRLPEAGRALGRSIREFRDGISGHGEDRSAPAAEQVPAPPEGGETSSTPVA